MTGISPKLRDKVFRRDKYRCRVNRAGVCQRFAHDPHHKLPKARGGPDTMENLIAICRACHDYIDGHRKWAYANGFLIRGYGVSRHAMEAK